MAKHTTGKNVSKGQRISCVGNTKKPAIIVAPVARVENAMRTAFLNIKCGISYRSTGNKIVSAILDAAKRNAGNLHYGRGWTANVSAKTLKQLTAQGVFA